MTNHRLTPSSTHIHGLYGSDEGFTFYETEEDRDNAAKETIQGYLDEDGWSEGVTSIFAFTVTHRATAVDVRELVGELDEDGCDEEGEYWESDEFDYKCNYELQPIKNES
jgi:hypothetical protein